jgi:rhodanese-related sulfurtransferase
MVTKVEVDAMKLYVYPILLAVLVLGGILAGCTTPTTDTMTPSTGYVDVTPQEAKNLIDNNPGLIIIDVSPAYDDGHLPGAVNYYLGDGSLDNTIPMLDKDATYLVYCHIESASRAGAQALVDAGFMNVYRLQGEFGAWIDAGYPVEK